MADPFLQNNGAFYGAPPLPHIAGVGATFAPMWCDTDTTTLTTTATRLYYIPYFFPYILSYTGLRTYNAGTGDNGDTFRVGVYQASRTTGLPTTLVKDLGEVTLTGAAAVRSVASSFSPAYVGWHYICLHSNQTIDFFRIRDLAAGTSGLLGTKAFGANTANWIGTSGGTFGCYSVDTAYGALAASAVAPTALQALAPILSPYRT